MDRDWWVDSLVKQRLEIVEQIRDIHVRQSQSLRHVRVPEHTLKLAKSFVKQAPNVCVLEARKQCLRYEVLYSFSAASGFGVYQLLAEDAKDTPVQLADDKFNQWLAAVGSLLRYALNLLLAPKRPEFQTIKLFNSFYVYEIAEKLARAENILLAMGYRRPSTNVQDTELRIEGGVDLNRVVETAADLAILQCDLEFLRGNAKILAKEHPEVQVQISDILLARSMPDQTYPDTYEEAIVRASSRQYLPPVPGKRSIKYPPRMASADCLGTEERGIAKYRYANDRSKSSEGVLDQAVPVHSDHDDHRGQVSLARTTSMPDEHSWGRSFKNSPRQSVSDGKKESRENSVNSASSLESSMMISYSGDIPRPNPEDLPDPVFDDEAGFAAGGTRRISSDTSYEGNRVGLYVNPSSAYNDPLNMLFSPDDNHGKGFQGNVVQERVEADGPDSNDPATTNISKIMLNQTAKQSSASSVVEGSPENQSKLGHDTPPERDSIGSEGRRSLSSPLNSVGGKRKRDSPFTSLHDEDALPKTSSHTSIGEGVAGGRVCCDSLEKPPEKGNTVSTETESRPRAHHISEKSRDGYKQTSPREERKSNLADGQSPSTKNQWVCDYCTFMNSNNVSTCEVCEIPHKVV